jgi:hypothetical protein
LTLHHDLLEQAHHLAFREPGKPRQASLRRAVSTAYYSLFHFLLHEATNRLFPARPTALRERASRAFTHFEAKNVCEIFAREKGGIKDLTDDPLERQLAEIAATFIQLQESSTMGGLRFDANIRSHSSSRLCRSSSCCDGKMEDDQEQFKHKRFSRGPVSPQQVEQV